jgi:hypothetical protein
MAGINALKEWQDLLQFSPQMFVHYVQNALGLDIYDQNVVNALIENVAKDHSREYLVHWYNDNVYPESRDATVNNVERYIVESMISTGLANLARTRYYLRDLDPRFGVYGRRTSCPFNGKRTMRNTDKLDAKLRKRIDKDFDSLTQLVHITLNP